MSNEHKNGDLRDGGSRKTYSTGAQKEDQSQTEGKGRYDLLPPTAIRRIAEIFRKGAIKYADRNWEKGLPLSRFLDSAKRHLDQYQEGMQDEDHLAQAAWNLLALLHTEEMIKRGILPKSLDDLPSYMPKDADPDMWRQIGRWATEQSQSKSAPIEIKPLEEIKWLPSIEWTSLRDQYLMDQHQKNSTKCQCVKDSTARCANCAYLYKTQCTRWNSSVDTCSPACKRFVENTIKDNNG